jgi:hypothetical protein
VGADKQKAEPLLTLDMVVVSQETKWGLQYDTYTLGKVGRSLHTNDRTICRELKLNDIKNIQSSN